MEIKEETHLVLPGDQTHYTNNTASKFKVRLPYTIRLAPRLDWYATYNNLIIPRLVKKFINHTMTFYVSLFSGHERVAMKMADKPLDFNKQNDPVQGVIARFKATVAKFDLSPDNRNHILKRLLRIGQCHGLTLNWTQYGRVC